MATKRQQNQQKPKEPKELTPEELENQQAADLPDREAMSLVNANLAAPINLAAALNVLSDGSVAGAGATQTAPIGQGMTGTPVTPPTTTP